MLSLAPLAQLWADLKESQGVYLGWRVAVKRDSGLVTPLLSSSLSGPEEFSVNVKDERMH